MQIWKVAAFKRLLALNTLGLQNIFDPKVTNQNAGLFTLIHARTFVHAVSCLQIHTATCAPVASSGLCVRDYTKDNSTLVTP